MITHGSIRARELQKNYPQIKSSETSATVEVKCTCPKDDLAIGLIGAPFSQIFPDVEFNYDFAILIDYSASPMIDSNFYEEVMTFEIFEATDLTGGSSTDIEETVELTTQDIDIPLAEHEAYKLWWNYDLYCGYEVTNTLPAGFEPATADAAINSGDKTPSSNVDAEAIVSRYAWIKPGQKPPEGKNLKKFMECTKPGVESYRRGVPIVTLVVKCRNLNAVIKHVSTNYSVQVPKYTFGFSGGQWFSGGCSIKKNGRYWECRREYSHHSQGCDKDLYPGGNVAKIPQPAVPIGIEGAPTNA